MTWKNETGPQLSWASLSLPRPSHSPEQTVLCIQRRRRQWQTRPPCLPESRRPPLVLVTANDSSLVSEEYQWALPKSRTIHYCYHS